MILKKLGTLLVPVLFLVGCNNKDSSPVTEKPAVASTVETETVTETHSAQTVETVAEVDVEKGARLYKANCTSCHNKDPNINGAIGPRMVDAPLEVMTSMVMTGKYPDPLPAGYTPKRKTSAMRAIKRLQNDIPSIYAWVQSQKK